MSSIFAKHDQAANNGPSFWSEIDMPESKNLFENPLLSSYLFILTAKLTLKRRLFVLSQTRLYYCKDNSDVVKKFVAISWKKLEPFIDEQLGLQKYGYRLSSNSSYQDFYTENSSDLDKWLKFLRPYTISTCLEEDYVIIKEIDKGNFAHVFLAEETNTHGQYAIKSIKKQHMEESTSGIDAIANEISIMRRLNHPGIINLHRVYEDQNFVYLVLDFISGGNLFHRIQQKDHFSESTAAKLMKNLLEVIAYVHSQNIIHRDIKPENVLMLSKENDEELKICDFGLAIINDVEEKTVCGSPGYVAPEILNKKRYNDKVDIFSAGIVLYIILSGKTPFYGNDVADILRRNKLCKINFCEKNWTHASSGAIHMIRTLTNLKSENRPSAAQALMHPWIRSLGNMSASFEITPLTSTERSEKELNFQNPEGNWLVFHRINRINDRNHFTQLRNKEEEIFSKKMKNVLNQHGHALAVMKKLKEYDNEI